MSTKDGQIEWLTIQLAIAMCTISDLEKEIQELKAREDDE